MLNSRVLCEHGLLLKLLSRRITEQICPGARNGADTSKMKEGVQGHAQQFIHCKYGVAHSRCVPCEDGAAVAVCWSLHRLASRDGAIMTAEAMCADEDLTDRRIQGPGDRSTGGSRVDADNISWDGPEDESRI